jgi:hypothetical protein
MKLTLISSLYCVLMLASVGLAGGHRDKRPPRAPGLAYLYTVNITGGEFYPVGNGPRGIRIVVPIVSGNFEGPKLKGESEYRLSLLEKRGAVPAPLSCISETSQPLTRTCTPRNGHAHGRRLGLDRLQKR